MWNGIWTLLCLFAFLYTLDNHFKRTQENIDRIQRKQDELSARLYDIEKQIKPKRDGEYI